VHNAGASVWLALLGIAAFGAVRLAYALRSLQRRQNTDRRLSRVAPDRLTPRRVRLHHLQVAGLMSEVVGTGALLAGPILLLVGAPLSLFISMGTAAFVALNAQWLLRWRAERLQRRGRY